MSKFIKKRVVVSAYQTSVPLEVFTLEGMMHANVGDWIITGVKGEVYPCKPDIFAETYELLLDDGSTLPVPDGRSTTHFGWPIETD